jgi:hypothetical protein
MFDNLNPFSGVSWSNPLGNAGNNLKDALFTGKGTPWGPGNQKGYDMPTGPMDILGNAANIGSGDNANFGKALFEGDNTPWASTGKKNLTGLSPFAGIERSLFPGGYDFAQGAQAALFDEEPAKPVAEQAKDFNPDEYAASDYADVTRAGQEEVARNLSRQQNDILAGQQRSGGVGSSQTGLGLSDALSGASQGRQNVAARVGQMQYGDKLGQYNNYLGGVNQRNQGAYDKYAGAMGKYNSNRDALGKSLGAALAFI